MLNENPFKKSGFFATPESMEALQDYVAMFKGSEGVIANTIMGMTWNLCAEIVQKRLERSNEAKVD